MNYFISFHDFLIEHKYEREEVLEQASHGYIMTLWDVWEEQYIDYCDYMTKTFIKSKEIEYSIIKFVNWVVQIVKEDILIKAFVLPERTVKPYTISFNTKEELQKVVNSNKLY